MNTTQEIKATRWQQRFLARNEFEGLLVTDAGAGKTTALIMDALNVAAYPGTISVFFASSYARILGVTGLAPAFGRRVHPEQGWHYDAEQMRFYNAYIRSTVRFDLLENQGDEKRQWGWEYDAMYFDNIDSFDFAELWNPYPALLHRLQRSKARPPYPRARITLCYHNSIPEVIRDRFMDKDSERNMIESGQTFYTHPPTAERGSTFYYFIAGA